MTINNDHTFDLRIKGLIVGHLLSQTDQSILHTLECHGRQTEISDDHSNSQLSVKRPLGHGFGTSPEGSQDSSFNAVPGLVHFHG